MKHLLVVLIVIVLSAGALGGLWAGSGTTTISASASGTAATGGTVTVWSAGRPDWSPVEDAVGTIDADHNDSGGDDDDDDDDDDGGSSDDGDGGGLATVKVPAAPAGSYRVTIFLTDPAENVQAYSYFNICMKVTAAVTSSNLLTENAPAFTSAASVIDHDADSSLEVDDCQFLNAEKGFVSFFVSSGDGTLVDSSNRTPSHASYAGADARAFDIGIQSGSFFTKDADNQDHLSPEFTIEVNQG